ncbi:hypothetical protein N3930_45935, partial [Bacillus thuringiensis]|nr:hypothetical protein [Bacillus thuringiensis]
TKEDAEDIFQETWIKVFSSRHQLFYVDNYKKWITTICVRTFYDFYRKKKRWKDRVLDLFHKKVGALMKKPLSTSLEKYLPHLLS